MQTPRKFLVAAFAAAATAVASFGALAFYQGTGINKAPIKFIFLEPGAPPVQILLLPRELDGAVRAGDLDRVRELLAAGANPNLFTHFTGPALNDACDWVADLEMMKLLVSGGADVNQPNMAGTLPLHRVISSMDDEKAEAAFRYLLSQGADIDAGKNSVEMTPREWLAYFKKDNLQKILDEFEASRPQASRPSPGTAPSPG